MRILSLCVVVMAMTVGCLDSGGDGGSSGASGAGAGGSGGTAGIGGVGGVGGTAGIGGVGGVGGGSGAICDQGANKLRGCGLATAGALPGCDEPEGAGEECQAQCLLNATCSDLAAFFCDTMLGGGLATCTAGCPATPEFTCDNGMTIDADWECDGFDDCDDGSDEVGCTSDMFACATGGQSVPASFECDGEEDCSDGSDEASCPTELTLICN